MTRVRDAILLLFFASNAHHLLVLAVRAISVRRNRGAASEINECLP